MHILHHIQAAAAIALFFSVFSPSRLSASQQPFCSRCFSWYPVSRDNQIFTPSEYQSRASIWCGIVGRDLITQRQCRRDSDSPIYLHIVAALPPAWAKQRYAAVMSCISRRQREAAVMLTARHNCRSEGERASHLLWQRGGIWSSQNTERRHKKTSVSFVNRSPRSEIKCTRENKVKHTQPGAHLICKPYRRLSQSQSEDRKQ